MSSLLNLSMILALVLSFKGLQLVGATIVSNYGFLGVAVAIAGFYCAGWFIDRRR